jgi:hypothetical protein
VLRIDRRDVLEARFRRLADIVVLFLPGSNRHQLQANYREANSAARCHIRVILSPLGEESWRPRTGCSISRDASLRSA